MFLKSIISSALFLCSTFSLAENLVRLPDIEPTLRDRPSIKSIEDAKRNVENFFVKRMEPTTSDRSLLNRYQHLDPTGVVPSALLERAIVYFENNKHFFENKDYITVMDFSKRSNKKRMFIINIETGFVFAVRTAHGKGGDLDHDGYVESVGNVSGSKKSSRGFFKVAEVYYGQYGRSLRLDGLSSTNSKTRSRAIVIHGSDYVKEANVIQGRSWGCFSLSWEVKDPVVDRIRQGSLMYADWSHLY